MKVIISGYVGKKITGVGRNLICLLNYTSRNHQYIVYTNYDMKDDFVFSNQNIVVKTYGVSKNNSVGNLLWTTFVFPLIVLKEKADKALIPNFTLLLLKFRPTIVILHDLIEFNVAGKFSPLKMFYRTKLADPITAKRADKIITVSENSKRDIVKFLKIAPEKIKVIHNGVDQDKFQRIENTTRIFKMRNWPEDFILYSGSVDHPGKNAITVVRVFERLKESSKYQGCLVLAGMPGKGYDVVKNSVEQSKYKDSIFMTGYVLDDELVALYSKCRVFVFVSLYEGFGIPPLEALSCGAKVVVSNTSSLPEVVGNVGVTVEPNDLEAVTDAVYQTIQTKTDGEYRKRVLEHLKKYDWRNLGKDFETVF